MLAFMAATRSSQRQISSPLMATMRSPGSIPASATGELGSTPPMSEVALGRPDIAKPATTTTGSTRFITGPASAIEMRRPTVCPLKLRWRSDSGRVSPGSSPSIFT